MTGRICIILQWLTDACRPLDHLSPPRIARAQITRNAGATESKEAMEQLKQQLDGWREAVTETDKCVVLML